MTIFQLICLYCGVLILSSKGSIGSNLNYSQVYCEYCKLWYIPKTIGEINSCPKCSCNNVHGDE